MKVALIGASGYGNIGDDTYPLLWRRFFPSVDWHVFNSDLPAEIPDADLVLFGGGGLIYSNETAHFDYMRHYMQWAIDSGVPFGFLSCGVQAAKNGSNGWQLERTIEEWPALLGKAEFIGVRDPHSLGFLTGLGLQHSFWAPDLCYLFAGERETAQRFVTICPAASVKVSQPRIMRQIEQSLSRHPDLTLLALNMGSVESDPDVEEVAAVFEACTVVRCRELTPDRAVTLIAGSAEIITGRYHGLVIGRSLRKPVWFRKGQCQWKLEHECLRVDPALARRHVQYFADWSGIPPVGL